VVSKHKVDWTLEVFLKKEKRFSDAWRNRDVAPDKYSIWISIGNALTKSAYLSGVAQKFQMDICSPSDTMHKLRPE